MTKAKHSPIALQYYRKQVMLSLDLLAKKTGIAINKLILAESQTEILTYKQLKNIAEKLCIPDFLLLTEKLQPKQIPNIIDHRNYDQINNDDESKYQLQKIIHEVIQNREDLLYTYDNIDIEPIKFNLTITGNNAIEDANTIRNFLEVDTTKITIDNNDDYYHAWRALLEVKDILVLEIARQKIHSEGMALYFDTLPIVAILTSGQNNSRKLFTMIHELVHLALRQSSIDGNVLQSDLNIEQYCNHVAGYVLLPQDTLDSLYKPYLNLSDNIRNIRRHTKISYQAIAIQLRLTEKITQEQFDNYLLELNQKNTGFGKSGKQYTAYNHFGKFYIQQILSATMDDSISVTSAMNILNLNNISQLQYLQEKVFA